MRSREEVAEALDKVASSLEEAAAALTAQETHSGSSLDKTASHMQLGMVSEAPSSQGNPFLDFCLGK